MNLLSRLLALHKKNGSRLRLYVVVTIALSWAVKQIIDRIPSPK